MRGLALHYLLDFTRTSIGYAGQLRESKQFQVARPRATGCCERAMALDAIPERRSGQSQTRPSAVANERTNRLDSYGQTDFATSAVASDRVLHAQRHNGQGTENHALVVPMRRGWSARSVAN